MISDDEEPLRLAEACERWFGGRLTPSALRREAKRGNLEIIRIANKDFVTKAGIQDMLARCRVPPDPELPRVKIIRPRASEAEQDELRRLALRHLMENQLGHLPGRKKKGTE